MSERWRLKRAMPGIPAGTEGGEASVGLIPFGRNADRVWYAPEFMADHPDWFERVAEPVEECWLWAHGVPGKYDGVRTEDGAIVDAFAWDVGQDVISHAIAHNWPHDSGGMWRKVPRSEYDAAKQAHADKAKAGRVERCEIRVNDYGFLVYVRFDRDYQLRVATDTPTFSGYEYAPTGSDPKPLISAHPVMYRRNDGELTAYQSDNRSRKPVRPVAVLFGKEAGRD